jgi:hypothetical protein
MKILSSSAQGVIFLFIVNAIALRIFQKTTGSVNLVQGLVNLRSAFCVLLELELLNKLGTLGFMSLVDGTFRLNVRKMVSSTLGKLIKTNLNLDASAVDLKLELVFSALVEDVLMPFTSSAEKT